MVPSARDTTIIMTYHSSFKSHLAYGPNVVITQGMTVLGTELFSSTVLAGPEIRKRDPCWCGSGQKFKHCHMKKFGFVYLRPGTIGAFKKPLYSVTSMKVEIPRASGSVFTVGSGYD
jgi:hypothetical protein